MSSRRWNTQNWDVSCHAKRPTCYVKFNKERETKNEEHSCKRKGCQCTRKGKKQQKEDKNTSKCITSNYKHELLMPSSMQEINKNHGNSIHT